MCEWESERESERDDMFGGVRVTKKKRETMTKSVRKKNDNLHF